MAAPQKVTRVAGGGFWNPPQVQYSKETHNLLKGTHPSRMFKNYRTIQPQTSSVSTGFVHI